MDLRGLTPRLGLPAAFLLGAISMVFGPSAVADRQAATPKLVVVDIDRVLREYAPAKQRQEAFGKAVDAVRTELDGLKAQVEAASAELQNVDHDTEDYQKAQLEVQLRQARREKVQEIKEAGLNRQRLELSVSLYDEINTGIAAFAAAKNIEVVLRARVSQPNASPSQRFDVNQVRDVLYYTNPIDLTNDVIAFLKSWTPPAGAAPEKH